MSAAPITPALAEAIVELGAALLREIERACQACPELTWLHTVAAAGVACRGVAATAMADAPDLTLDEARRLMLMQLVNVLAMPAELVQVVDRADGEPLRTIVLPVRRH